MPLIIILLGIMALLVLILGFKVNAFLSLIIVALGVGLGMGMSPADSLKSIQSGVGSTLGSLALIMGLGAILGGLIAESGAAQVIARRLTDGFGIKNIAWAMVLTGFIVGIPMFYNVAFLMVLPIIFAMAKETKLPILYVGLPIIAALSVTHGFLPPHPAPTTIVEFYGANIQLTLLYGLVLCVPTVILAGVVFGKTMKKIDAKPNEKLFKTAVLTADQLPSFGISVFVALIPVLMMGLAALGHLFLPKGSSLNQVLQFIGDPVISLFIAVIVAVFALNKTAKSFGETMDGFPDYVKPIAMILLIIAGGGAFKQVLIDSGTSSYIVDMMSGLTLSPLVLAWTVAAVLRIALGSATVAGMTAAGIIQPLVATGKVSPELLVLATGAGSLTCSQVNDTGFWMFKEYFNLTVVQTLKSWTVMETIVSIVGLAGCLILDKII
ncbi:MAG: gluconate:H+ symporter [Saprospiraceae bacterium]|nr:gluconate:H+ symporter [Saprospiraceae bacterium]MCF8252474.1 gluconate:H+ symporter [Saprospiraceae bacterium]MCF8282475.1 gluconate:H+ symporter [Bacteroidales bacterium]MCF8312659.1 gluconate:H+ symporter [Saprospiraceae bacterium]MCF8441075.1 gluconate:H+ symporter [Saprospiraceae bacterium]